MRGGMMLAPTASEGLLPLAEASPEKRSTCSVADMRMTLRWGCCGSRSRTCGDRQAGRRAGRQGGRLGISQLALASAVVGPRLAWLHAEPGTSQCQPLNHSPG